MPEAAADVAVVGEATDVDDYAEEASGGVSGRITEGEKPDAYMNPTTAVILMMAKKNSASP